MKLFLIALLAFPLILISCNNHKVRELKNKTQKKYNLIGKIEGIDSGWLYLGMYDTSQKSALIVIDSAKVSHSNFQFKKDFQALCHVKSWLKNWYTDGLIPIILF